VYLNDKNTFSVYTTQNFSDGVGTGSTKVFNPAGTLLIDSPFTSLSDGARSSAYNLNYKLDFEKKGHNLELEATFSDSNSPEHATRNTGIEDISNERSNTLFNVDYTNPVSKNGKLELGAEIRINNTENKNKNTNALNSSFKYDRKMYSAYINYGHKFDKVTMQIGARLEQYNVDGLFNQETKTPSPYTSDIFSIYPSAFFTYTPSEKNQFQLSYSRRVDRPSIQQVNPIREWSTPLVTSLGNPDLLPQFTNSFEVNYTRQIKGGSLTLGTFFRRVNDEISTILYKDPNDPTNTKQIKSDDNFDANNRYGLEASLNYRVAKWWRLNSSLDFYSQTQRGVVASVNKEVTNSAFNIRVSNSFTATKNLRFQLFTMFRGANKSLQFDAKDMWMVNTGASYRVLKGKGNITLSASDIFRTARFRFSTTTPFTQAGQFRGDSRTVRVGFNYRFGGGKNKAKRRRNRDDNEKRGGGGFI
jgi:outer membrane receptor protein involved in Fe transport